MSAVLAGLTRALGLGAQATDYLAAAVSGAVDGFLLGSDSDAAALAFVAKNVLIPIADAFIVKLPRGLVHHATGQLAMTIVLALK